jgi:hypothetical protein
VSAPQEAKIYGAMLLNNFRAFKDVVGDDVYARAIEGLPNDVSGEYAAIVPVAWVPVSTADAVFEAIAREAGEDLEDVFPRVIERGVEKTLHTAWRWVLRLATDRALISRTPRLFAKTYDRGRLDVDFPAPGRATVVLTMWPQTPKFRLLATAAGIRTVLRLTGRRDVRCEVTRTVDGAVFRASWVR